MRILCATDLLPKSEAAIARAGLLSARLRADLTLLHIVSGEQSPAVQEKVLQDAFAHAKSRVEPLVSRTHRTAVVAVRVGVRVVVGVKVRKNDGVTVGVRVRVAEKVGVLVPKGVIVRVGVTVSVGLVVLVGVAVKVASPQVYGRKISCVPNWKKPERAQE